MASPQPRPENGGNPAQWFATIMDQLVRNDTNLHQVLTQLGQTTVQATIQAQAAQAAVVALGISVSKLTPLFPIGLAKEWATAQFRQLELNPQHFVSWEAILAEMKHVFEDPDKKHNAQRRLRAFKQRDNQTADEFFMHFNNLKIDAGFNDEALLDLLHVNIRPELLEHAIRNSTTVEDTLASWETALRHYDHHRRDFDLDRSDHVNRGHFGDFGGRRDWGME